MTSKRKTGTSCCRADPRIHIASRQPCRGHKYYRGGPRDGSVSHLLSAPPSDYPMYSGSMLIDGTRNWYEIDYEASEGTEVVYRFIGMGRNEPERPAGAADTLFPGGAFDA